MKDKVSFSCIEQGCAPSEIASCCGCQDYFNAKAVYEIYNRAYDKGWQDAKSDNDEYGKGVKVGRDEMLEYIKYLLRLPLAELFEEFNKLFKCKEDTFQDIILSHSSSEIIKFVDKYKEEKEKELEIGDEVKTDDGRVMVFLGYNGKWCNLLAKEGETTVMHVISNDTLKVQKTGRHFSQVEELFKLMKESDYDKNEM